MSFPNQYAKGSRVIPTTVDHDTISGLALPFTPAQALLNVRRQTGLQLLAASPRTPTLTPAGFTYDLSGVTDQGDYVLDYLLLPASNQFVGFSIPGSPSDFQGFDPVLGPPFAPIDYQLFIHPFFDSTSFVRPNGPEASLFWTVPDLAAFAYSFLEAVFPATGIVDIWYSNTTNDPSVAILRGTFDTMNLSPPGFTTGQPAPYIAGLKYAWATAVGVAPVGPGVSIDGGNTFLGKFSWNGGINPGAFAAIVKWSAAPPDTFSFFTLQRSTMPDFSSNVDNTNGFIPALVTTTSGFPIPGDSLSPVTIPFQGPPNVVYNIGDPINVNGFGYFLIRTIAADSLSVTATYPIAAQNIHGGQTVPPGTQIIRSTITDGSSRTLQNYWYRLFGITTNGMTFPFNDVGLIPPYHINVKSAPTDQPRVSWQTPDLSIWP